MPFVIGQSTPGTFVPDRSLLARSEEDFRKELEDDVRKYGENGAPTLISKSNLAARLGSTNPEVKY